MGNWAFALFLMLMSGGVLNAQTADSTPIDISSSLAQSPPKPRFPAWRRSYCAAIGLWRKALPASARRVHRSPSRSTINSNPIPARRR